MEMTAQELRSVQFHSLDQNGQWSDAFRLWLGTKAANTRRSYETAWQELLKFTGKMPWEISSVDVERFVASLRDDYAPSTVQQRLAAISSFYSFTQTNYMIYQDGKEQPLYHYNPAKTVRRPRVQPYGKANPLDHDQARALLGAIDRGTVQGKRDYALLLAYVATGRRNSEIRVLQWGQIESSGHRTWYHWQGKANSYGKYELPGVVFQAMVDYLSAAGRLDGMTAGSYIFTALTDHANRLPGVQHDPERPLSARYVRDLVKKYARLAGLDPEKLRVHDLRHTAAILRQDAGDGIGDICSFLGHKSPETTVRYLHQVGGRPDRSWTSVADKLGL